MNNIVKFPNEKELWASAIEDYKKTKMHADGGWSAWRSLGEKLIELRAIYKADQAFGAAVVEHGIDLTSQNISDVMWLAKFDIDAFDSAREYWPTSLHPSSLRNKVRVAWGKDFGMPKAVPTQWGPTEIRAENVEQPKTPEITEETQVEPSENPEIEPDTVKSAVPMANSRRSRDEIASGITTSELKAQINKAHKSATPLIEEAFALGTLKRDGVAIKDCDGRILFTHKLKRGNQMSDILKGFDMTKPAGVKKAADELMPFFRKYATELSEEPEKIHDFWKVESKVQYEERQKQLKIEEAERRKLSLESRGEQEIIHWGVKVWPPKHEGLYTYEQLRRAWRVFMTADDIAGAMRLEQSDLKRRANLHRHMSNELVEMMKGIHPDDDDYAKGIAAAYFAWSNTLQNGTASTEKGAPFIRGWDTVTVEH